MLLETKHPFILCGVANVSGALQSAIQRSFYTFGLFGGSCWMLSLTVLRVHYTCASKYLFTFIPMPFVQNTFKQSASSFYNQTMGSHGAGKNTHSLALLLVVSI